MPFEKWAGKSMGSLLLNIIDMSAVDDWLLGTDGGEEALIPGTFALAIVAKAAVHRHVMMRLPGDWDANSMYISRMSFVPQDQTSP
jgi:hypothetical protein